VKPTLNRSTIFKPLTARLLLGAAALTAPALIAPTMVPVAHAADEATKAPVLTVVTGDRVVWANVGTKDEDKTFGKLDAGTVDSMKVAKVDHDFVLRNDNKVPVTIGRLQPTCGCTSVILGEGKEETLTLAPGQETKIRVSVDVTRFRGAIRKAVRAFTLDNTLLATMEVSATVQGAVSFNNRIADFGTINYGTAKTLPLTLTLSSSISATQVLPKLISSNPNITVTTVRRGTDPAHGGNVEKSANAPNERYFQVEVSPKAPIGQIMGTIAFDVPLADAAIATTVIGPNGAAPIKVKTDGALDPGLATALRGTVVALTGEVVGRIAANPNMVIFGNANEPTHQITLTAPLAATLKQLKVTSASEWVTARLLPASGDAKNSKGMATATLELTLSPRAPLGTLETKVHVVTTDGEDLTVPVLAEVEPRK